MTFNSRHLLPKSMTGIILAIVAIRILSRDPLVCKYSSITVGDSPSVVTCDSVKYDTFVTHRENYAVSVLDGTPYQSIF